MEAGSEGGTPKRDGPEAAKDQKPDPGPKSGPDPKTAGEDDKDEAVTPLLPSSVLASSESMGPSAGLLALMSSVGTGLDSARLSLVPSHGLPGLPAEDVERYRQAFNDFDYNNDGNISTQELHMAFRRAGQNPTEARVSEIINEIDQNYSGRVEWPEFAASLADMMKDDEADETTYKETFRVFSKDDEGCITAEEMKFVLSQICSIEEAEEMLEVVDRNGDGVISYSEFRCMMGANPILL